MIDLYHTDDMALIRSILMTPEIWDQVIEDGTKSESFYPGQDYLCVWLLVQIENNIIGAILVHHETGCSVNIHPVLYNKYRRHGREMMKSFFKWFISLPDDLIKVNCTIPDHLKIVQNFAVKVGFKKEGVNRKSFIWRGKARDQIRYGLTRKEIEGLLWLV